MSSLSFVVDSALLRELGEKLVETVHVALVELVKNCYDADATRAEIIFQTDPVLGQQIVIQDNGKGMSFSAVEKYWMRIATTNKAGDDVSSIFGRPYTGAKGIGRFSCRRLGNHLRLITCGTKDGDKVGYYELIEKTEVEFPWTSFQPGIDITKVECPGRTYELHGGKTGTTLIISGVPEEWTTRGFNWLKRQLAVLAANSGTKRDGFVADPGFEINLTAPDFEGGVRDLREDLMNAGWGTLRAYINDKHQAICELNALGLGRRTIVSNVRFTELNDVSLNLAIMVDDREQMRDTGILSKANLQKILPEWGGVQVRYRGFRVLPYGDDDWLSIDRDRGLRKTTPRDQLFAFAATLRGVDPSRSLLNQLSMRSYVGNVNIGSKAEGFEMKISREGFVSTPAFDQLKQFVRFAIEWTTILRDFYLRQESFKEAQIATQELERVLSSSIPSGRVIDSAVSYLTSQVDLATQSLEPEEQREIRNSFQLATETIRKVDASNQAELLHLRLVASTSTLLLIFAHEVRSLLGLVEKGKTTLNSLQKTLAEEQQKLTRKIVDGFNDLKTRLEQLLGMTSLVGGLDRSEPYNIALKDKLERVSKIYDLITSKYSIKFDFDDVPNNIVIKKILEAEVYSIFLNVFSNSIKSVIAAGKDRRIKVSAYREDGLNKIHVLDTGIGVDEDRFEEVFVPFISDPDDKLYSKLETRLNQEDQLIIGSGSGLGLGIVREIVSVHGGTTKFLRPEDPWKSKLEISLP